MSYLTKEKFKEELSNKIYSLRPDERQYFIQAFKEIVDMDTDLEIDDL